jgi:hypothetical protein
VPLAPLPPEDALGAPFVGPRFVISEGLCGPIIGVKFDRGGCGRRGCCCCCGGRGPKLGDTDCPCGIKLGERVADCAGDERCEPGVGCDKGERCIGPSGCIMGWPLLPSALGGPWSDLRCCWRFKMARCWSGAWLGDVCADTGGREGPRLGLPVCAQSSAWTSMPVELPSARSRMHIFRSGHLSPAEPAPARSSCTAASDTRRRHCGGCSAGFAASPRGA